MSSIKTLACSIGCVVAMAGCKNTSSSQPAEPPSRGSESGIQSVKPEGALAMNQTIASALKGEPREANLLALGEVAGNVIPAQYFAVISAQNEGNIDVLATSLYWSGNEFNKVRSIYWFRNTPENMREVAVWGGLVSPDGGPYQPELRKRWKDIFQERVQQEHINAAIGQLNASADEKKVLMLSAFKALLGSKNNANSVWKYYYSKSKHGLSMESRVGMDWIALCRLETQGFPGPRDVDKYLYWLLIAAENGDAESQFVLANSHNVNDYLSGVRQKFWLKKASDSGWDEAKKQFKNMMG